MRDPKRSFQGVGRTDAFLFDPDTLVLVTEPLHPLYAPEVHLPVNEALVRNIMVNGVIEPVIISVSKEVIDGRQRVKAARVANERLTREGQAVIKVPAVRRRAADDNELFGVVIAANEHRRKDSPLEQAVKAQKMLNLGATPAQVCLAFGWQPPALKVLLKLLDCDPKVKAAVAAGQVSPSAAARLAPLDRAAQRQALARLLQESGGKRATVKATARAVAGKTETEIKPPPKAEIERLLRVPDADLLRAFAVGAAWARGLVSEQAPAVMVYLALDPATATTAPTNGQGATS